MKSASILTAAIVTLALGACSDPPDSGPDSADSVPAPTAEQAVQNAAPAFASAYTILDLEKCDLLGEQSEEGSSAEFSCLGFGDAGLFVQEGDGRFDLDAGVDDGGFQTIGAFNDINDTIEWRLKDGQPFAVIFRYRDVSMESNGRTVLAVETVGSGARPGCRVAQIAGNSSEPNVKARELADAAAAEGFACPDEPVKIGNAS